MLISWCITFTLYIIWQWRLDKQEYYKELSMFLSMNSEKRRHTLLVHQRIWCTQHYWCRTFQLFYQHRTQMRTRHEQASFLSHRFIVLITILSMCSQKSLGTWRGGFLLREWLKHLLFLLLDALLPALTCLTNSLSPGLGLVTETDRC